MITVDTNSPAVATTSEWFARRKGTGARTGLGAARAFAKENGVALVMLGDDGLCMFLTDGDRLAKREYKPSEVRWV